VSAARKPSILVVDDTPENLRLLTNLFREHDYEVRPVPSGKLALQAVRMAPPDLILLDINMPEMNGFDVCDALKADEMMVDIPVIFVSALDETFDKVRAFSVGGLDYITKPFQVEEVLARVRTHLALRTTQLQLSATIARLRELEAMRETLFHMVVHDLKSPLWGIESLLQRVAAETKGRLEPQTEERLERVRGAAGGLARMVHTLLDVSRIESGAMPVVLAEADVRDLVDQAVANVGGGDALRPIEITMSAKLALSCDADLVRRVIENLVGNGLKHTPQNTPLAIRAQGTGNGVRIEVSDKGPGVPAAERERIFEKFGTLQSGSRQHSSGLGLAFCHLAVHAHGGSIGVDDAPGGGSTFWFELPSAAAA
jgi:two-component system sensor histidine kinase/response regulator